MTLAIHRHDSPHGPLTLSASPAGIRRVTFERTDVASSASNNPHLTTLRHELDRYFRGTLTHFSVPLDLDGSEFDRRVWAALTQIPYGTTCSYLDVARHVGGKNFSRAVGGANGRNPVAIVVPCHRVVASDRSLGGYAFGLSTKLALLSLEGVVFDGEKVRPASPSARASSSFIDAQTTSDERSRITSAGISGAAHG